MVDVAATVVEAVAMEEVGTVTGAEEVGIGQHLMNTVHTKGTPQNIGVRINTSLMIRNINHMTKIMRKATRHMNVCMTGDLKKAMINLMTEIMTNPMKKVMIKTMKSLMENMKRDMKKSSRGNHLMMTMNDLKNHIVQKKNPMIDVHLPKEKMGIQGTQHQKSIAGALSTVNRPVRSMAEVDAAHVEKRTTPAADHPQAGLVVL